MTEDDFEKWWNARFGEIRRILKGYLVDNQPANDAPPPDAKAPPEGYADLQKQYPTLDVAQEFIKCRKKSWERGRMEPTKIYFERWLRNAEKWQAQKRDG